MKSFNNLFYGLSILWSIACLIGGMRILGFLLDSEYARETVIYMPIYFILWFTVIIGGHKAIKFILDWLMGRFNDIP